MKSLELVKQKRSDIIRLAARHGAHNVRIFGSVAREEADGLSDIDILVDLNPGRSLLDLGGLLMDLQELLGCPVDVVTEKGLRSRIKERVLREAVFSQSSLSLSLVVNSPLRESMDLKTQLQAKRAEILVLAAKHGASNVRLFGSVARGEAGPKSDVDILIDLESGRSLLDQIALGQDLEDLLGIKIDVVTEKALHWYIKDKIL